MVNFVTKNAPSGYLWARSFVKNLIYLKSALSNLSNWKIFGKKTPNFEIKEDS